MQTRLFSIPVTREEYHNRLVKEWVHRNKQRRLQAQHMSDMLGIEYQSPAKPALIQKKHCEEKEKEIQRCAQEAEHIRKVNEAAGLLHLKEGLRSEHMKQHDQLVDSSLPLPGLGSLRPRLVKDDEEATVATSPKNLHDVSELAPTLEYTFTGGPLSATQELGPMTP
eukprot:4928380-Amphidinium_carterae.1